MTGKYQCSLSKIQCTAKAQGVKEWREAELQRYTPADAVASLCSFQDGVDFRGGSRQLSLMLIRLKAITSCHTFFIIIIFS